MSTVNNRSLIRTTVCPLVAALIWGAAFVAQGIGAQTLPPFTFNAIRLWIGVGSLLIISFIFRKKFAVPAEQKKPYWRNLVVGGLLCGTMMAVATNLQQTGLADTDPGKAGFITSLYVVLVPVFGLLFGRRAPVTVWIGAIIAIAGLYFLCINDSISVTPSDGVILLCSLFFAFQILFIDRFSPRVNGFHLCCAQLVVSAAISTVPALLFETTSFSAVLACWIPLLYLGIFSSGVAYTLQIISQRNANPAVVTLLLSLESVFAVLTGWVVLHDTLSARELFGCLLMFLAVTLANISFPPKKVDIISKS